MDMLDAIGCSAQMKIHIGIRHYVNINKNIGI